MNIFFFPSNRREPKLTKGILQQMETKELISLSFPYPLSPGDFVCKPQKKEQLILFPAEPVNSLLSQLVQKGL